MQVGDLVRIDERVAAQGEFGLIILCDRNANGTLYAAKIKSGSREYWVRGQYLREIKDNESR